jgi:WD40 repeat protein
MKNLTILLTFFISVLASAQSGTRGGEAENTSEAKKGKSYAIIIGVSDYSLLGKDKQLNFADDDAKLLKDYFMTTGITDVKMFLNEDAAKATEIGTEIHDMLLIDAKSGDEVIIFFAGHGDVDTKYKDGYLLLNEVKPAPSNTYKWNQALSLRELQETIALADENGVKVKLIIDACRSGSATSTNPHAVVSNLNSGLVKMVSCQASEFSEEAIKYGGGHGVFTYYLVQGLMGLANANDDKIITMKELQRYVEDKVAAARNDMQNPQFIIGNPQEEVAVVNSNMLKKAEKEENLSLALSTLAKNKSTEGLPNQMSNYCLALTQLFLEQTIAGKFFVNELDSLDKQTLAFGSINAKKNHENNVMDVASRQDGKFYASTDKDQVLIYAKGDLKNPSTIEGLESGVNSLQFDPYAAILYVGLDNSTVVQYDFENKQINKVIPIKDGVRSLAMYNDSLLLIGSLKGSLQVYDINNNKLSAIKAHKGSVNTVEVAYPFVYSAGADGKLIKSDIRSKKKVVSVPAHDSEILDINILKDKKELLTLGSDGILVKWGMDKLEKKNQVASGMKSVSSIVTDPFEKICFIGGSEKKLFAVELFNMQLSKPKSAGTSGVVSMEYDTKNTTMIIGEKDGSITLQKMKVNPDLPAALELYSQLRICDASPDMLSKLNGTLIVGLTNRVNIVLDALVNGNAILPTVEEITKAIIYAQKAQELGKAQVKVNDRLEINVLMLEIYKILLEGNKSQYTVGLKKIDRVLELDPDGAYVYNTAALLHLKFKELEKAIKMIEQAETLSEIWIEPTYNYGRILMEKGDLVKAEQKFKQTIEAVPDLAKGYASLMDVYLIQNNYKEALLYAQKAKLFDSTRVVPEDLKKYAKLESDRYRSALSSRIDTVQVGDIMGGGIVAFIEPETNKGIIVLPYDLDQMMTWADAKKACESLNANGYSDWRMPTLFEFTNISVSYLSVPGFKAHFDESYWTATLDKEGKQAFWVGDRGTAIDLSLKTNYRFVRPIRTF